MRVSLGRSVTFAVLITLARSAAAQAPSDTVSLFAGLEGSKQPQDLGINANMGTRLSVNWGAPIVKAQGLGWQIGIGSNLSDAAVHVLDQIGGPSRRTQTFLTIGLFQRDVRRLSWAIAYDHLWERYYDDFQLGQIRARADVRLSSSTAVGVRVARGAKAADAVAVDTPVHLRAISQADAVFSRTWPTHAETSIWVGVAGGHHDVVWVFPDIPTSGRVVVYGADLHVPLSERLAITGAANLVTPTSTGTVDAYLGVVFYPRGHLLSGTRSRFLPAMPVADNTALSVDLAR